jgi:hypothetical protein
MSPDLLFVVRGLECELHDPATRANAQRLSELIHEDFREVGRSGRTYSKPQVIALLLAESHPLTIHAGNFQLQTLSSTVALLTYTSGDAMPTGEIERRTHRASVWILGDVGWQMVFHQGTPEESP